MRKKQQKAFSHGSYAKRVLKSRGYMGTDRTQMVFERGVKVVADSDMVIQDADKMMNSPLLSHLRSPQKWTSGVDSDSNDSRLAQPRRVQFQKVKRVGCGICSHGAGPVAVRWILIDPGSSGLFGGSYCMVKLPALQYVTVLYINGHRSSSSLFYVDNTKRLKFQKASDSPCEYSSGSVSR
jgi:hypothetical protein